MNISSLSSYSSVYFSPWSYGTAQTESQDATTDTSQSDIQKRNSTENMDLSQIYQMMSQGMPPQGPPPTEGGQGENSDLRGFLDKMRNGTATADDLKTIMSKLQENSTGSTDSTNSTESASQFQKFQVRKDSSMDSFIEKLKNGTATKTDLEDIMTKMKEKSTQMTAQGRPPGPPPGPPPTGGSQGGNSELSSFLDKVQDGTATEEDLETIMNLLQENTDSTNSTDSDSTNSTESASQFQKFQVRKDSDMDSFMEKLMNGTATETDMKEMMDKIQEQFANAANDIQMRLRTRAS